jgi:hypothetical protein
MAIHSPISLLSPDGSQIAADLGKKAAVICQICVVCVLLLDIDAA